jgi:hypothetical protein
LIKSWDVTNVIKPEEEKKKKKKKKKKEAQAKGKKKVPKVECRGNLETVAMERLIGGARRW